MVGSGGSQTSAGTSPNHGKATHRHRGWRSGHGQVLPKVVIGPIGWRGVGNFDTRHREARRLARRRRRSERPVAVITDVHWSAIHGPGPGLQSLSLQSAVATSSGQLATGGQIAGGYLTFPSLTPRDARR